MPQTTLTLRDGRPLHVRRLERTDADAFGCFLEKLGTTTRSFFGPHPLTAPEAARLCAAQPERDALRLVVAEPGGRIVAYFILELGLRAEDAQRLAARGQPLDPATAVTLAPVVADDYQNTGVAGAAFPSVVEEARATGRTHLVLMGGTQERNARAVRFYLREGFTPHGRFEYPPGTWNIDMTRTV
ncbi:MAG: GNAT family N-acetyltransferase [Opitutae bacterium]|nr:GNAT family N-acetyltransferase [Opitutae bacterium]